MMSYGEKHIITLSVAGIVRSEPKGATGSMPPTTVCNDVPDPDEWVRYVVARDVRAQGRAYPPKAHVESP
jgi:hypothetical protein